MSEAAKVVSFRAHVADAPDEAVVIGKLIRRARRAADVTQQQLGDLIGTTFQQIGRYENGQRVSAARLAAIARALGRPVQDFFPADLRRGDGS